MWVQVLCLRLVEGKVLDLDISDEGVRLAEDGCYSILFSRLGSGFHLM